MFVVGQAEQFTDTPPLYIINRWQKDIVRQSSMVRILNHKHAFGLTDDAKRCVEIHSAVHSITDLEMCHEGIFNGVLDVLRRLHEKCVKKLVESDVEVQTDEHGRQYKRIQVTQSSDNQ